MSTQPRPLSATLDGWAPLAVGPSSHYLQSADPLLAYKERDISPEEQRYVSIRRQQRSAVVLILGGDGAVFGTRDELVGLQVVAHHHVHFGQNLPIP